MPYDKYNKTTWRNGTEYSYDETNFNNIENGIIGLEKYAMYKNMQAENMGKAMKKLRTNQNVKIAIRGDSVMFGYNTVTSGEDGERRVTNTKVEDRNPSEYAKSLGYEGVFFYGHHPLVKLAENDGSTKKSVEVTGNSLTVKHTEVTVPDVFIQTLNEVFDGHIEYVDKVYTGDSYVTSYCRYDAANADIEIVNLGINDALAAFLGTDYVGQVPEFMTWCTKLIEREIEAGNAMVIVTPIIQTTVSSYDTDARTSVDVYEKILYNIGDVYGIPVIDGNELNHNYSNRLLIDFTHLNSKGNSSLAKKMAAPFIAGDMLSYNPVYNGSWLGSRPQEDSLNVRGNACIEYTDKAPAFPLLLDNNDLYDTGVNRIAEGIGVYINYPLDGVVPDTLSNDELFEQAPEINVLWRQADLYARSSGARGSDGYKTAYDTRMKFLQGKHGYHTDTQEADSGAVTWAFYVEKDGIVIVPSIYAPGSANIDMVLDFYDIVPEQAGAYLNEKTLSELQTMLEELDTSYTHSDSDDKNDIIARIKVQKGYNVSEDEQGSPDNICDWLGVDTIDYEYVEPSVKTITLTKAGYYGKRQITDASNPVIKVTTKGWHTITIKSNAKDKFMIFGIHFLSLDSYKHLISSDSSSGSGSGGEVVVHAPYIGDNGNWFEWDTGTSSFVDSNTSAAGTTPVRGTDYWTADDIATIKAYIDQQLGVVANGTY